MPSRPRPLAPCVAAIAALHTACALPVANRSDLAEPIGLTSVHVTNDSPEIVHVLFVGDTGMRVFIGSVSPYSKASFSPRFNHPTPGRFYTRRMGTDATTPLQGAVDPFFLNGKTVLIQIGAEAEFDFWRAQTGRRGPRTDTA